MGTNLLEEFKKALEGKTSQVTLAPIDSKTLENITWFSEEVRKRGYNPDIALMQTGFNNREKQEAYLRNLPPIEFNYEI